MVSALKNRVFNDEMRITNRARFEDNPQATLLPLRSLRSNQAIGSSPLSWAEIASLRFTTEI